MGTSSSSRTGENPPYGMLGGDKLQAIAEAFHVGHYSSVSVAVSRLESLMREDDRCEEK
jgi:hypothetical protein